MGAVEPAPGRGIAALGAAAPAPAADHKALLDAVAAIARDAGRAILEVYRGEHATETKLDGTPVTAADHAAEAVILPRLAALTPDVPVISEERVAAGEPPDLGDGRFWLVDPLDGTREFVKRNDEFCVSIGLIEAGQPVLGVLYGPVDEVLYGAADGDAIRAVGAGAPAPIACRRPPADGLDLLVSRSHRRGEKVARFVAEAGITVRQHLPQGSALKFGRLAAGEADLYARLGPTSEWDTAAGHAIVLAAGGQLETLDGGPLVYGKADMLNPGFLAWGRR